MGTLFGVGALSQLEGFSLFLIRITKKQNLLITICLVSSGSEYHRLLFVDSLMSCGWVQRECVPVCECVPLSGRITRLVPGSMRV